MKIGKSLLEISEVGAIKEVSSWLCVLPTGSLTTKATHTTFHPSENEPPAACGEKKIQEGAFGNEGRRKHHTGTVRRQFRSSWSVQQNYCSRQLLPAVSWLLHRGHLFPLRQRIITWVMDLRRCSLLRRGRPRSEILCVLPLESDICLCLPKPSVINKTKQLIHLM